MLSAFLDNKSAMVNKVGPVFIFVEPGALSSFSGATKS